MSATARAHAPEVVSADRNSRAAAAVLALTLPGDVVLYVLLPLHAAAYGVSLFEVGILLAANRLIRIVGYGWVARAYQRRGPRWTCAIAIGAAAASTFGYAVLTGVVALLAARLLWGLAFAAINIAVQVLATSEPTYAARRSARSRSIVAAGPTLALIAGSALSLWIGPRPVFAMLGAIALGAYVLVARLPAKPGPALGGSARIGRPTSLDVWSFVQGLVLDGIFVIGLSVLASQVIPDDAALAVGAALALRYFGEMTLGPLGGYIAQRWGVQRALVALSLACALGIAAIGVGLLWMGAVLVVLLRALLQPLPAPAAALRHPGAERIPAIARLATWRDIGAGVGPLVAGAALSSLPVWSVYGTSALLLAISSLLAAAPRR